MKFLTDDNLPFTGVVEKNGYEFGDRLLEDVIFQADMNNGVVVKGTVRVHPKYENYLSNLDQTGWLKAAEEVFLDEAEYFDTDQGQVWTEEDDPDDSE
jgi:hypothetical protein